MSYYYKKKRNDSKYKHSSYGFNLNAFLITMISLILLFLIIVIILVSVLIANLKSSGDAFSKVIANITNSDFPGQIQSGMLGLVQLIGMESNSVRDLLINTPYCSSSDYIDDSINDWKLEGKNLDNNKFNKLSKMNLQSIHNLNQKCLIEINGRNIFDINNGGTINQNIGLSSSITVIDNLIYFSNYNGNISCYHLLSCQLIWEISISNLLGFPNNIIIPSFISPSIYTDPLSGIEGILFGIPGSRKDIININTGFLDENIAFTLPCYTISLNRFTGELLFKTLIGSGLERDYFCEYKTSYSIFEDKGISGFDSSNDYFFDEFNNIDLTFQGSIHSINLSTGELIWKTYLLNSSNINGFKGSYSGGGIKGKSNPPIYEEKRIVYFSNNHLFNYTQDVFDCLYLNYNINNYNFYHYCLDQALNRSELILHNSVFGVNLDNGLILWSSQGIGKRNGFGIDSRTNGCKNGTFYQQELNGCSVNFPGPGYGYIQNPILYKILSEYRITVFGLGGNLFTFNAENGDARWSGNVSVGSTFGHYGIAFNKNLNQIFITVSGTPLLNINYNEYYLKDFTMLLSNGSIICNSGLIMSIDSYSGDIIWQAILPYSYIDNCNLNIKNSTENFKSTLNFTSIDGNPSLNSEITTNGLTIPSCPSFSLSSPLSFNYSKIYSNPSTSSFYGTNLLFVPSLLGSVIILNADNGFCLTDISCPSGGIFNNIIILHDTILFSCGGFDLYNDFLLIGNTLKILNV